MRYALIQPRWNFAGSTYFGCHETHLPFELLFGQQQLQLAGHDAIVLDAHLEDLAPAAAIARLRSFDPEFIVLTTAPTYLFWRCPQPELRVPALWVRELRSAFPHAIFVAIGPHGSATPRPTLTKLDCDVAVLGEPDQVLAPLATQPWSDMTGLAWRVPDGTPAIAPAIEVRPGPHQTDMSALAPLDFAAYPLHRRQHRHHVFSGSGRGAEIEAARGCPWTCNFCNKTLFRNHFRPRPVAHVLAEVETLRRHGFTYIYFIDEIFGCARSTPELLEGLTEVPLEFGMQTRLDLWNEDTLATLGRAGCISLECGIESITAEGRARFRKGCRLETDRLAQLLRAARAHIPWVQANLIAAPDDDHDSIEAWRAPLIADGIWVSQPVPLYPYPGTPLYRQTYGEPDDHAWERAHADYLAAHRHFSDVQDQTPRPLAELESLV